MIRITLLSTLLCLLIIHTSCSDNEKYMKDQVQINSLDSTQKLVCLLTEPELEARKAQLKEEIFSQATKIEAIDYGYQFYFKDEEDRIKQLIEFILTERKCCPFFKYQLNLKSFNKGISLKITGPIGAKMMIKMQLKEFLN